VGKISKAVRRGTRRCIRAFQWSVQSLRDRNWTVSKNALAIADMTSKWAQVAALIAGALLWYFTFYTEQPHKDNIDIVIESSIDPIDDEHCLVTITCVIKNIGRLTVTPLFLGEGRSRNGDKDPKREGLAISIVEYPELIPRCGNDLKLIDWTHGSPKPTELIDRQNLLTTSYAYQGRLWDIPPGVTYREPFAFVASRKKLYGVFARFWSSHFNSFADQKYILANPVGGSGR